MVRRRKERPKATKEDIHEESFSQFNPFASNSSLTSPPSYSDGNGISNKKDDHHFPDISETPSSNGISQSIWPTFKIHSPTLNSHTPKGNLITQLFDPHVAENQIAAKIDTYENIQTTHMKDQRCYVNTSKSIPFAQTHDSSHKQRDPNIIFQNFSTVSKPQHLPSSSLPSIMKESIISNEMHHSSDLLYDDLEKEVNTISSPSPMNPHANPDLPQDGDLIDLGTEPVRTSSGLYLTHRKTPNGPRISPRLQSQNSSFSSKEPTHPNRSLHPGERPIPNHLHHERNHRRISQNNPESPLKKTLTPKTHGSSIPYAMSIDREGESHIHQRLRSWVVIFIIFVLVATIIAVQSIWSSHSSTSSNSNAPQIQDSNTRFSVTNSMIQLSIDQSDIAATKIQEEKSNVVEATPPLESMHNPFRKDETEGAVHRNLRRLRVEFEDWVLHHSKSYDNQEEKDSRFHIWMENHHKTLKKNQQHGPCKLTGKPVFGSNHFKDLTLDEFRKKHLTGYHGPRVQDTSTHAEKHGRRAQLPRSLSRSKIQEDPRKLKKYMDAWSENFNVHLQEQKEGYTSISIKWPSIFTKCKASMSCYLKYLFGSRYYREPTYDEENFPESVDWRKAGAVTSIHTQGNCGACWGITAVETIESAYFIKSSELLDLAETEPILCDDSCQMCYGGWPQNAYEYAMDNNGLPLESSVSYDGDALYLITMVLAGENDEVDGDYVDSYMNNVCPDHGGNTDVERYAKPNGYGYATERCLCYTSGDGCDCDEQDEALAIANLASFGPATMCLDASVWMDYDGGIITAESGCSQSFMDMNHCVQVVGYAFLEDENGEYYDDDDNNGSQNSKSNKSGSRDFENREGYFIVRNQWSEYWGMNGYAYVAMGNGYTNTCGSLNDITQVYFD